MSDFREEEKIGKVYDSQLAWRLVGYLRPYRWSVVLALALTILVTPFSLAGPWLFHIGVDRFIDPAVSHKISLQTGMRGLSLVTLAFTASLLLGFAVQYLQMRIMQNVGQKTLYDLRNQIFARLQILPMSFYDRSPVGRLVTRVTTDVDALNDLFASGIAMMVNDVVQLAGIGGVLLWMNYRLALATFTALPLILVATMIFRTKVRDANRRIRVAIARINSFLQEYISGMTVVQLFNREKRGRDEFAEYNRRHMEAFKDTILAFALYYPAVELFSIAAIAMVFWYGGIRALAGTIQVGILIAFMQYAQQFFRPIQDLSEKFNILQSAMASSERIFKLLDEPVPQVTLAGTRRLLNPRGEIEFRNVWHAYTGGDNPGDEDWVLRDVLIQDRAESDRGHRRTHGRGQDHTDRSLAALLRISEGRDSSRRRGHPRVQHPGSAPPIRHRAAGSVPIQRHAGIERAPRHGGHRSRARGKRAAGGRPFTAGAIVAARSGNRGV